MCFANYAARWAGAAARAPLAHWARLAKRRLVVVAAAAAAAAAGVAAAAGSYRSLCAATIQTQGRISQAACAALKPQQQQH